MYKQLYRGKICQLRLETNIGSTANSSFCLVITEPDNNGEIECLMVKNGASDLSTMPLYTIDNKQINDMSIQINRPLITKKEDVLGIKYQLSSDCFNAILHAIVIRYSCLYHNVVHETDSKKKFIPGESKISYGGRVYGNEEIINLMDAALEFWLTYGRYSRKFEKQFAEYIGTRYALLVNSGSSANLLSFMALTSPLLGNKRVCRGDEIITVATCFPTTIAPIIQYGAVPVFVDVRCDGNIDVQYLERAYSTKTKAVMLAHCLGNPFDIATVKKFCDSHNLWLIEDNCDSLGSKYDGHFTGTWGHLATGSFYPPHHITMGEGGVVVTSDPILNKILLSLRDWGRDCWCDSGHDDTCGKRFTKQYGTLPFGYDHKYVYSHFGYNLKVTEMQAAIGCAQLDKLPGFVKSRQKNFNILYDGLKSLESIFNLPVPNDNSMPSWFGFLITIKDGVGFTRNEFANHLESNGIQTRNLFAGNILRHPCFDFLNEGVDYKVIGLLEETEKIMKDSLWIGLFPGLKEEELKYMIQCIKTFAKNRYL